MLHHSRRPNVMGLSKAAFKVTAEVVPADLFALNLDVVFFAGNRDFAVEDKHEVGPSVSKVLVVVVSDDHGAVPTDQMVAVSKLVAFRD